MKESKVRIIPQRRVLPDYERQRLEKLKRNKDLMEAQGIAGSLASQIYDKSQAFATSVDAASMCNNKELSSDDNDDELYMPEHEGHENEFDIGHMKSNTKGHSSRSRLGSMAAFVKEPQPPMKKQRPQVDKQMEKRTMTKLGSMSAVIKNTSIHPVDQRGEQLVEKRPATEKQPEDQFVEKQLADQLPKKNSLKLDHRNGPNSTSKDQATNQQNGNSKPGNHSIQSQKKQQQKTFCAPGSLSAFRTLRKKQSGSVTHDTEIETPSNQQVANECQYASISEPEAALDNEPQLRGEEDALMAGRIEIAHEKESHPKEARIIKKHRGPTKLVKVHARTIEERPYLVINKFGQPIGPTVEIVQEFTRFLGTVAKNSELAPLNYVDWPSLPTLDKIWDYVQEKYIVPEEGRKWVMAKLGRAWRVYKCRTKRDHFKAFDTDEQRMIHRPLTMPKTHFEDLLKYWHLETTEEESRTDKRNRDLLDDMHTMGPNSYAILRHKLQQEDPNKQEPSQAKVYKESRARNPNKTYKTNFAKTKDNIEQMEALAFQENEGGPNNMDPYYEVIKKPEHNGRVRLFGEGVTKTDLKKNGNKSHYIIPEEFLQSIQAAFVEQLQVANPGLNLVVPKFSFACIPSDATNGDRSHELTGEQSSAEPYYSNQDHPEKHQQ